MSKALHTIRSLMLTNILELGKEKEELEKATRDIAEFKEKRDAQFARKQALEKQIMELKKELEQKRQGTVLGSKQRNDNTRTC
jgi:hypothetical protein